MAQNGNYPSPNGANGRDDKGRFGKGNAGGPANPHAARTAQLRSALMDAVTDDDIQAVAQTLVREARQGNVQAGRELLDRVLGKSHQSRTTELTGPNGESLTTPHAPTAELMVMLRGENTGNGQRTTPSQSGALHAARNGVEQPATEAGDGQQSIG
jgi:hypothetical protein